MKWNNEGLIPVIIQNNATGKVLMLGYQNSEALEKTVTTGQVYFFSRSRNKLWHKGETSGNHLLVKDIQKDCDEDALLIVVEPMGPTCHTGNESCFFRNIRDELSDITSSFEALNVLMDTIKNRRTVMPKGSYTASLFASGLDRIIQKVGEEAVETIISAKNEDNNHLVGEVADLIYHLTVLLSAKELEWVDIYEELRRRQ